MLPKNEARLLVTTGLFIGILAGMMLSPVRSGITMIFGNKNAVMAPPAYKGKRFGGRFASCREDKKKTED